MIETSSVREEDATPAPRAGDLVCGKYRLLRPLGEGGMGLVFEAEHLRLRQSVAIKFLRPEVLALPEAVDRFEREARASARLRGPHVVRVLDVDTDERSRPYMVMELLRGRDLEAELRATGPFPIEGAVDLVLQACVAVAQAHAAGIIHRDLKPSNLFLTEEAGKQVLKVLDFGISKVALDAETAAVTSTCVTVGTPLYMSPEQMRSSRDVDGRADIWSLGVILYELVAGAPPFLGTTTAAIAAIVADAMPSLRQVRADVPEALERVLVTALAKSPADCLPTAEAFGAALLPFASADGVAGPFSLRPSERDFAMASSAMARTPSSPRVSDPAELLELPASRSPSGPTLATPTHSRTSREALRTFAGTLVIGMALAGAMTVVLSRTAPTGPSAPPAAARHARSHPAPMVSPSTAATASIPAPADVPVAASAPTPPASPPIAARTDCEREGRAEHMATGPALGAIASRTKSFVPPASSVRAAPVRASLPTAAGSASGRPTSSGSASPFL